LRSAVVVARLRAMRQRLSVARPDCDPKPCTGWDAPGGATRDCGSDYRMSWMVTAVCSSSIGPSIGRSDSRRRELWCGMAEGDASKRGRDAVVGLVIDQLSEERSRKASIEQRALSAITSSGTLVTLLLGAAALVTRRSDFAIPAAAAIWASVAIGLFVATAAIAIFALIPRTYADVSSEALDRLVGDEAWERSSEFASLEAARLRVDVIATARANNAAKARTLTAALAFEVIAVLCLAIAAILILETRY
jgi:hypothetical protein